MKRSVVFEGVVVVLLISLLFLMAAMITGGVEKPALGIGDVQYAYAGGDALYVFTDDSISAITGNGSVLWTFEIPDEWSVCCYGFYYRNPNAPGGDPSIRIGYPIVASDNGVLYAYMKPSGPAAPSYLLNGTLMAISGGRELWEVPLAGHNASVERPEYSYRLSDTSISASGGRVYVFHDFNETAVDGDGTVLWTLGDVAAPAAVDERGFVYVASAPAPAEGSLEYPYSVYVPDYREPSNAIRAYYPNGTPYWALSMTSPPVLQYDRGTAQYASTTLPIYENGTVYVPMYNGVSAIDPNGTARWTRTYGWGDFTFAWPFDANNLTGEQKSDIATAERMVANYDPSPGLEWNGITIRLQLYAPMPFDSRGDTYLQARTDIPLAGAFNPAQEAILVTLGPDGREIARTNVTDYEYVAARDGIGYAAAGNVLRAVDAKSGRELWNRTLPVNGATTVTLDRDNVCALVGPYTAERALNGSSANLSRDWFSRHQYYLYKPFMPGASLSAYPCDNITYVSFQNLSYEVPIVLGKTNCTYSSAVYAFDRNGTLLWQKQLRPLASMQVTQNGTIFYQTPDGRVGVTGAGLAAGLTLTAILYLFLRFVCLGAVVRAKARLGKNEKRNRILDFIARNPGSSLYEVTRGTGISIGTVRYHLFILHVNHKIVASRTDGKYVRYFAGAGTFSKEERLVLSLMRREAMGKVLGLMVKKPGITNADMARELGIRESVVCRCTKELAERGIVSKGPEGRGCSVAEAHRDYVATAMERIHGQ